MELSSFQLAWLGDSVPSPELGIITNCTPNHLDWHGNWDSYRSAKQRMLRGPFAARKSILSSDDNTTSEWNRIARERLIDVRELPTELKLPQPGKHLRQNARLAFTAAHYLGVADEFAIDVLERFTGLPHRMESIGEVSGRQFVNDSKATSAAATMAALHAFDRPVWLLAGGVYGGERLDELAQTIVTKAAGAVFFGKSGEQLAAACLAAQPNFRQQTVASLAAAVPVAWQWSSVGDTILLSPACASFDQFADFAARGQAFGEIVDRLACSAGGDVTRQKLLH
jgi:UDP-N-acetylmuramoylalanine--D-glutamate ligase